MLGEVDESHIIRTIEYWDIERKRYPQYDHTAVIVAEKINARFLNVINLFNSAIPIIAVQLNALRVGDQLVLNFTKVLDEIVLGQEDEETEGQVMDRAYWEARGSKTSMKIVDECLSIVKETQPSFDLKYNKYYIGLASSGVARNFILFRAKRLMTRIEAKIADQPSWSSRLEDAGLSVLPGIIQRERLVFQVRKDDVAKNRDLLKELFEASYQEYTD